MSDKDRSGNLKGSQGQNFNENTTLSRKESSKKSRKSELAEGNSNGNGRSEIQFQGLSTETQKLIESIRNSNHSNSSKKKDVPHSMVEEILREAKLKAASRGIDTTKSSREESRKNNSKLTRPLSSVVASSSNFTSHNDDTLSELDHDNKILKHGAKQDSGSFMADEFDDKTKSKKISEKQQQQQQKKTDITKNNDVSQPNRSQSRSYLPTRLASLIGIGTGDDNVDSVNDDDSNSSLNNADNDNMIINSSNNEESFELANDSNNDNVKSSDSSAHNNSKGGPSVTIDTNVERSNRKEQRYIVRPRLTKKRAVIRRASARLVQPASDYQRSSKSPVKTVEISNELDEINAQFEETLNQFSKRYQDSTVALAEKSHLLKRNQELHHNLASKEEEIEYLKNELWLAGNKIQNYESDLKDIIEQQLEPLALTHEDLVRIERELEDQEVLVNGYQKENDKLVSEIKSLNERLRISDLEHEKQLNKTHELCNEIEHLKGLLYEKETQETVPEGTIQQIEELKKEIERLKEKEKTYEFKELALKGMDDLKKELSDLRDRESEYMIKIDDMEHQLSLAREEIDAVSQERTESLEKMTEEMNIMKFTYESQIEGVKKDAISKDGRETRFRKLQGAIEKIESKFSSNPEVTQICTDLRRGNLLPQKKRRKSAADSSKNNKEPTTPRSPTTRSPTTTKSLKKATSQSSLGGMSRASTVTSPTPSVLSSVSAFSGKDDLMDLQEDDLIDIVTNEEFAEMKVKLMKCEKENQSSREAMEKLEDKLKLLRETKVNLEKELETLKKEHAEKKEHYEQKMHEMEELLLELPSADSTDNSMAVNVNNNPIIQPAPNLLKELDTKQNIIEELVGKLKRMEEQLEYYQKVYLEKSEEFEKYVEKVMNANANQSSTNGGTAVVNTDVPTVPSVTEVTPNFDSSNAFKYLSDALAFDDGIGDLSSLPITSDIMGLFGGLGDDQEISVIEKLIAQLERTIVERTMQLDAAHQRANDAESKLLALSREKMSWGSGYDTTVRQLKMQVEYLQELLQMERKVARKEVSNGAISSNDTTKSSSNESKTEHSTMDIQKLRSQIESLTAENITLKAELTTSETVRQAIHENTLTILQQTTKTNLATDEDMAGLRRQSMEKESEISVWKGRCAGLENVVERQRELLTLVVPSLSENKALDGKTRNITKFLADDGIDSKVIEGLNETAKQLVQQLREENAILRQTIVARQQISKKAGSNDASTQHTSSLAAVSTTPTTVQLEILAKQISEIETRFTKREKELQDIIAETKRQGELQLEQWKAKWGAVIDKKNSEIRGFRNELESLMKCLGKLDSVKLKLEI
ncbi:hypothetical protein GLOIN_2v1541542 [Rhizophagus clarus]|uniref:Uncharacterized protein n=1 Tax=Rhizophagus clarus TaxID=94130 RepID=A0A8H3M2M8_9GLOM|nr:hypothetical protein GLOIN_2v1541542 [Rhizophagus clarus]